ncbi:hypothetical protein ACTXT7_003909 [Hymenolepis weldensis]
MRRGKLLNPVIDTVPFKVSNASGDAVQVSRAMKCKATLKGKTAATVCYVANCDINPFGLEWIDIFNVLEPKMQNAMLTSAIKEIMKRLSTLEKCLQATLENGRGRIAHYGQYDMGLVRTAAFLDDIIVVGESEEKLQDCFEKCGFHLWVNKC